MNRHEKMSAIADLNPYHSIDKIVENASKLDEPIKLLGVKNVEQISHQFINSLENTHKYKLHTLDKSSFGGRAIDLNLINPITGRYMTGSSSGTAINVFLGINDIGIGVDGGGSVLAPAMSLNLFGFISPLIDSHSMSKFKRTSTDGIEFKPSIGYISYTFEDLKEIIEDTIQVSESETKIKVVISDKDSTNYPFKTNRIEFKDKLDERESLIYFLNEILPNYDIMISNEGPIDLCGFGDTVFGHFDETTKSIQKQSLKGYLRVVNMANATAICVPQKSLAKSFLLISESKPEKISKLLMIAKQLVSEKDELIERYFRDSNLYFAQKYDNQ